MQLGSSCSGQRRDNSLNACDLGDPLTVGCKKESGAQGDS